MARRPRNQVIQRHHICYEPEKVVYVRGTEHYVLTMLQRMVTPTHGFLKSLKYYILDWEGKTVSGLKIKQNQLGVFKLKRKVNGKSKHK